jgi:zinc protease
LKGWASDIRFDEADVDRERKIITEEWRLYQNPGERARKQIIPALYNDTLHSRRHPLGEIEVLKSLDAQQLKRFYQKWYRPEYMALFVIGDVGATEMENRIIETFSGMKNSEPLPIRQQHPIPFHDELKYRVITDPEWTEPSVTIYQKTKNEVLKTEDDFRNDLLERLYVIILNYRLASLDVVNSNVKAAEYHRKCELTSSERCHLTRFSIKENKFREGIREIMLEFERLRRWGVYESEMKRARQVVLQDARSWSLEKENVETEEVFYDLSRNYLYDDVVLSPDETYRLVKKYLPTIRIEDVNALRSRFNSSRNKVIAVYCNADQSDYTPDKSFITDLYATNRIEKLEPYLDEVSDLPLFTEQIEKGSIIEEKTHEKIGAISWKLSNGGTVVIKPTQFKNDEVLVHLSAPGGLSLADRRSFRSMELLSRVVFHSGIGPFKRSDLIKRLIFKKIKGDIFVKVYQHGFYATTSPEDLEDLIQLMRLTLTQPRFDYDVFQEQKKNKAEELKNYSKSAIWRYNREIFAHFSQNNDYGRMTTAEDIESIDYDSFRQTAQELFQNRGAFSLVIVGNVKPDELRPLVETYIASYPVTASLEPLKDLGLYTMRGYHRFEFKENTDSFGHVYAVISNNYQYGIKRDQEHHALSRAMQMIIEEQIREKRGLVYNSRTGYQFLFMPDPISIFDFNLSCAPENVETVITELRSILKKLREEAVDQEFIDKLKTLQQQKFKDSSNSNRYWIDELLYCLLFKQDIEEIADWKHYIESMTPESLRVAAEKYVNEENLFIGILLPKGTK